MPQKTKARRYINVRVRPADGDRLARLANHRGVSVVVLIKRYAFTLEQKLTDLLDEAERAAYFDGMLSAEKSQAIYASVRKNFAKYVQPLPPSIRIDTDYRGISVDRETWDCLHRIADTGDLKLIDLIGHFGVEYESRLLPVMSEEEKTAYFAGTLTYQQSRAIYERAQKAHAQKPSAPAALDKDDVEQTLH